MFKKNKYTGTQVHKEINFFDFLLIQKHKYTGTQVHKKIYFFRKKLFNNWKKQVHRYTGIQGIIFIQK